MTATNEMIKQIRRGADEADSVKLHRLAALLRAAAEIGEVLRDERDPIDAIISMDNLVERATRVAGDLCRETPAA